MTVTRLLVPAPSPVKHVTFTVSRQRERGSLAAPDPGGIMRRLAACPALVAVIGSASAAGVSTDPRSAPPGAYQMDLKHTQVVFAIRHLGITDYYGRFEKFNGTLNFNPTAPEKSAVDVTIDTSSVNVMSSELMGQLTGASVFDSAKFPTATF